ncbi:MAG: 50S ribosomal protein L3 [Thermodesulfobacteriota bacteirum]|nr:50S ribosomal protein L3 [Thermodesulfobacteriota bacterium]|tara:strand:- start:1194 stop:2024 length:831 start_codon:yes stop_codon:yes gene_type:complete
MTEEDKKVDKKVDTSSEELEVKAKSKEETPVENEKDSPLEAIEESPVETNEELEEVVDEKKVATSDIKLSGLIGTKIGMTQTITDDGKVVPTTVIKLGPCLALEKKIKKNKTSLKIGFEDAKPRLLNKSKLTYLSKLKVKPIKYIKEFDLLTPDASFVPGDEIKVNMFKAGDITDVTSQSKGRGFAGVIKRHNFAGLRHTHGTPQNQRSGGSIGACAYPGRVWKGQKMAGRYGGKKSTTQGLKVLGIDLDENLILIKGSVPGSNGSVVFVNHTRKG